MSSTPALYEDSNFSVFHLIRPYQGLE
jgi:hypothetical protein